MEIFGNTVAINLDRRPDRWQRVSDGLLRAGITPMRFPAVDGREIPEDLYVSFMNVQTRLYKHEKTEAWLRGSLGCLFSHIAVLRMALQNNWEYLFLVEDDAVIHPLLQSYVASNMKDVPRDWWSIRLGGGNWVRHLRAYGHKPPASEIVAKNVRRVRAIWCTTATVYRREAIEVLLPIYEQLTLTADIASFKLDMQNRTYGIYPFPTMQAVSKSDIGNPDDFNAQHRGTIFSQSESWIGEPV